MDFLLTSPISCTKISTHTRLNNEIDNYQVTEFSLFEKNQFKEYTFGNYLGVKFKTAPSPIYNCHGMSFACRRTNIDKSTEIRKIITEDGYIEMALKDTLPGDIVLYINSQDGDIIHSATVTNVIVVENNIPTIFVVSKWGKYREAVHNLYTSPYKNCIFEFYRLSHTEYEEKL